MTQLASKVQFIMINSQTENIKFIAKIGCLLFVLALGFFKQKIEIPFSAQKNTNPQIVVKDSQKSNHHTLVKTVSIN